MSAPSLATSRTSPPIHALPAGASRDVAVPSAPTSASRVSSASAAAGSYGGGRSTWRNNGVAGSQWFLVATQNHAAATGANAATLVEGGQFIALNKRAGSNVSTGAGAMTLTNGGSVVANGGTITDAVTL